MKDPSKFLFKTKTRPATEFGYNDEKRLQEYFQDTKIKLRWHIVDRQVQVWYNSPSGVYCVLVLDRPYDICRAIKKLEVRQQTPAKMIEDYERMILDREDALTENVKQISGPVADALTMYHKNRVSVVV